jgi:hypothetical protein
VGHVDRQVPEEVNVAGAAVGLQGRPLAVEEILPEDVLLDRLGVLVAGPLQGFRLGLSEGGLPLRPRRSIVGLFE